MSNDDTTDAPKKKLDRPSATITSQTPPAGVPPLEPDPVRLAEALGGSPIPVPMSKISRPTFGPASAPQLPPTFSASAGIPDADRIAIANIRANLTDLIGRQRASVDAVVPLLDGLLSSPELLIGSLNFDPAQARALVDGVSALLDSLTRPAPQA